jgi:upstream activation factor subunit UAF30
MAKSSKTTTKTVEASAPEQVVAPVVAVAASLTPVAAAASLTTKAKKTKAPKVAEEVAASAPASLAPVAASSVEAATTEAAAGETAEVDVPITEQSLEFIAKLQQLSVYISTLKTEYRNLEKKWSRELKAAIKLNSRKKRKSVNRSPSGFVKPTRISDELASFLGKENGTEMARTAVTRDINAYIRTNKLQDTANGRKIIPDAKLAALLKLKKTDELTYFNLQKYMSPHFSKTVKAVVPETTA